jgi:hypothetical protein
MKTTTPSFREMLEKAKAGEWNFVDANISHFTGPKDVEWSVLKGLYEDNRDVRDLASTILIESEEDLHPEEIRKLKLKMMNDPYHIVRLRLAVALWKRRERTVDVRSKMAKARLDPDVGPTAEKWYGGE